MIRAFEDTVATLGRVDVVVATQCRSVVHCSNTLVVGWADTEMNRPFTDRVGTDTLIARSPLRRLLAPSELGAAAVFLADPRLVAHTGDVVTVDGAYRLA